MTMKRRITEYPHVLLLLPGVLLLLVFLFVPIGWIIRISFYENISGGYMRAAWVLENYGRFLGDLWYLRKVLWFSFKIAVLTTFLSVLLAYPLALSIAKSRGKVKQLLFTLTLSPLLIGMVCLIFGWIVR